MTGSAPPKSAPPQVVGRERVFGLATSAAEISAAFAPGPELLLAAGREPLGPGRGAEVVASLLRTMSQRLGLDTWLLAFGHGPDELTPFANARRRHPGLEHALEGAEPEELASLLAVLARGGPSSPSTVLGQRVRRLFPPGRKDLAPCHLALVTGVDGTPDLIRAFGRHLDPHLGFWLADVTLGVRFRFTEGRVALRAHHPVIQEALESRCRKDGIDLV